MLFQPNQLVIFQRGRFAGCKAVITKILPEERRIVVCGISKYPKKVTEDMSDLTKKRRNRMEVFIKKVNPRHMIITRYKTRLNVQNIFNENIFENTEEKKNAIKDLTGFFRNNLDNGNEKWFFTKLAI